MVLANTENTKSENMLNITQNTKSENMLNICKSLHERRRKIALELATCEYEMIRKEYVEESTKADRECSEFIIENDSQPEPDKRNAIYKESYRLQDELRSKEDSIKRLKYGELMEIKHYMSLYPKSFIELNEEIAKCKEEILTDLSVISTLTTEQQNVIKQKFKMAVARMHYCFAYLAKDEMTITTMASLYYNEVKNVVSYAAFASAIYYMSRTLDKLPDNLLLYIVDQSKFYQEYEIDKLYNS
jgi:hypothetical protein